MGNHALRVEGLGKMYRIGGKQERYATLRDTLTDAVSAPFKRARSLIRGEAYGAAGLKEEIWALKDISFEVKHGEVVGIIGRNGAGKSTLLKILSQITEPTEGYAEVYGRVGSLLEVGTGFHPELTGRENIYLNGAILGMERAEIDRKFDEMVAFAEVEKFIDTPVKHYSSGMGLRLGFSVAAHLEPEILVIDEVLAVGDAQFQKKCLGKMSDVASEGRTVLFVSHNLEAVLNLCSRCILLQDGQMVTDSSPAKVIQSYNQSVSYRRDEDAPHVLYLNDQIDVALARTDAAEPRIISVEVLDDNRHPLEIVQTWDNVTLRVTYYLPEEHPMGSIIIDILDHKDERLIVLDSGQKVPLKRGINAIDCTIDQFPLAAGEFYVSVGLAAAIHNWILRVPHAGMFRVHGKDVFDLNRPPITKRMLFAVPHVWSSQHG